jgi:hypothetical protein
VIKWNQGSFPRDRDRRRSGHSPDSHLAYAGLYEHESGVQSALRRLHPVINCGSNVGNT